MLACTKLGRGLIKTWQTMVDLANYEVILLDCDGVIFEGEHALPGSIEALNYLESQGKRLYFVTNNASKSRETNALKLQGLGYSAKVEQIYGTSYAAPIYLRRNSPDISQVFAIGSNEFKQELKRAGLQVTSASDVPDLTAENTQTIRPDPSIQAVVCALSLNFTYMEGLYASLCVQNGAEFICCNYDAFLPFTPFNLPGSGCILAFLETATQKKAKIVGKPERFLFDLIAEKEQVDKSKFLMVGDRIDTDILFGVNSHIHTALVLTGASSRTDVAKYDYKPTYVADSLASLVWPSHYS